MDEQQRRRFYEIEKELALRIRTSPKTKRKEMYGAVYDELFSRVPYHPQLTRKRERVDNTGSIPHRSLIHRFIACDKTFLEVGAGDCALSFEIAKDAGFVFALDVSTSITEHAAKPENFALVISDGVSVPVPEGSIDIAYSNQLMEHLHADDALEQLANIRAALKPGGQYLCITPSSLSGPHDVSRFFDDVATGLHLKEYTYDELARLFMTVGFKHVYAYISHQRLGVHVKVPISLVTAIERLSTRSTAGLSAPERRSVMSRLPYKLVREIQIIGVA